MSLSTKEKTFGPLEINLRTEDFYGLSEKLAKWRINPLVNLEKKNIKKGKILGFVQGLRLSAQIAYLTRKIVSSYGLEANWGHLIHDQGGSCSPECDIIIHRPGFIQNWNGEEQKKPIMDFKFIECEKALAVISCKSLTRTVDTKYCKDFHKYNLKNIFLFAECCSPKAVDRLKNQAKVAGYKGFYYLYTIKNNDIIRNENIYIAFIKAIQAIAESNR